MSVRLFYTFIGVAGMLAAYFADFTIFGKYPKAIYVGVIAVSTVLLRFSPSINGRPFYAHYAVLLFPLAFAGIIYASRGKGYIGIIKCGLAFAVPGFIALSVPSVSGFVHFSVAGAALMGVAIAKKWFGTKRAYGFLMMLAPFGLFAIAFLMAMPPYGWGRLAAAFNPYADPYGRGYFGVMVRELLDGAVFFGKGNIPVEYVVGVTEPHLVFYTDLLLTALIANLGWIAFALVVGAMLFFVGKGFWRCIKQKSSLGLFVSLAVMIMFCLQAASYVVYNLGFLLAAPISLPLISYGNTAMVINLVLIGFMLSVFRTGDVVADGQISSGANDNTKDNTKDNTNDNTKGSRFVTWVDGKLTLHFKAQ
jgi:cell division protein FtsW (lipid II flippase)